MNPLLLAGVGDAFQRTALDGSMLLAVPVALLAGLVSFASPCVLPLVPGYLGYVSGMAGARTSDARGRTVLGVALFVAGFTAVFVAFGVLAGSLGKVLVQHTDVITRVLGVVVIVMGLVFTGRLAFAQRQWRPRTTPTAGLWGAPVLGVVFGLGWAPCIGPTLVAVYTLALDGASAGRGAVLSVAYCVGLGLPFLLIALGLDRSARMTGFLRRHRRLIMQIGGGLLILIGLALVTGLWSAWTASLQGLIAGFEPVI